VGHRVVVGDGRLGDDVVDGVDGEGVLADVVRVDIRPERQIRVASDRRPAEWAGEAGVRGLNLLPLVVEGAGSGILEYDEGPVRIRARRRGETERGEK